MPGEWKTELQSRLVLGTLFRPRWGFVVGFVGFEFPCCPKEMRSSNTVSTQEHVHRLKMKV